jgi:lysophospholipid acyltransferase (LPLAT)-like uncharacterized protein
MKLSPRIQGWLVGPLALFLRVLGKTWRVREHGFPCPAPESQCIDAIYHGDILYFMWIYRDTNCATMVSEHRDGEMIAGVVERFGGHATRGSSTRGGARAYLEMLKSHKDKGMVVTPDGPRGPRGVVQEGIIKMASDSGRSIRPHGYAARTVKQFKSWDEFKMPYPFTRVVDFVGDPLHVPPRIDRATRQELARELELRLEEAKRQAEIALARWIRRPVAELGAEDHDARPST